MGLLLKHTAHLEALGPMERAQLVAAVGGRAILKEQQKRPFSKVDCSPSLDLANKFRFYFLATKDMGATDDI